MRIIITNNPMVRDKQCVSSSKERIEFYETDYLGVLKAVRDRIHMGHSLVTHPLSGSVKTGETPYKTVIITGEKAALDVNSLSLIEKSMETCEKLMASAVKKEWNEKVSSDFKLIDYNLIFS